jgi:hypothetical protein
LIDWATEKSFAYILQGQHEVSANSIKLALMAIAAKCVFMDEVGLINNLINHLKFPSFLFQPTRLHFSN